MKSTLKSNRNDTFKYANKEKKKANPGEPSKLRLIFQTCNPWNPRLELNHEDQSPTNLILMDEIGKKYQFLKFVKIKKAIKSNRKKTKGEWNHKKFSFKNYLK